jgi:hypothetical protein
MNVIAVNDVTKLHYSPIKEVQYISGLIKCGGEWTKPKVESTKARGK